MTRIPLALGKHYLLIDSPISFFLIDNEENSVYRPSGVWQLDTWKLLPEKYQKDHPVYTLAVEYDESKLTDGKQVLIRESDIDLGDGVAGVSGQAVMLTGINDSLLPIPVSVSNNPTEIAVNNLPDIQKVNVCSHYKCSLYPNYTGEPAPFPSFLQWLVSFAGVIDCLIFSAMDNNVRTLFLVKFFSTNGEQLFFIGENLSTHQIAMKSFGLGTVEVLAFYHE